MADVDEPREPYKLYRGDIVTLKDLRDRGINSAVLAQRVTDKAGADKIPRLMVINSGIASYKRDNYNTEVLDATKGFITKRLDLPLDTQLNVLSGRRAAALKAELNVYLKTNFTAKLGYYKPQIGADPEIFVVMDGQILPAWHFLGSKSKPTKNGSQPNTGVTHAYWDGFQAEFDTLPHSCLAFFVDNIQAGLKLIHKAALEHDKYAKLTIQNVLPVDQELLDTSDPKYVDFGCMPSKNAYGLEGNKLPGIAVPYRFTGGHIHFGFPGLYNGVDKIKTQPDRIIQGVKGLDAMLALPCVSLFASFDNPVRRQYYGLPGEYRTPAHGLEYRTLSNAWLMHPVITHMVYETARMAYNYGCLDINVLDVPQEEIVDVILKSDVPRARKILVDNKSAFMALFRAVRPFALTNPETAYSVFLNGADSIIKDPEDFERNWSFKHWIGHSDGPGKNWGMAFATISGGGKL